MFQTKRQVLRPWYWVAACVLLGVTAVLRPVSLGHERAAREEALFQAIERKDHAGVEVLLRSGVSVNARRFSHSVTPWEPLLRMWTRWEYPDYPFRLGYTPLMTASIAGDVWTAARLLDRGADVQALESERVGPTALELAVDYRHPALVRLLLDRGADPDGAPGSYGPLLQAWRAHDRATMRLLLRHGARPLPPALKKPVVAIE